MSIAAATPMHAPAAQPRVRIVVERTENSEWLVMLPDGKSLTCDSHAGAQRAARNYLKQSLGETALSVIEWRF